MDIKLSELPLRQDGSIYHLAIHPEQLADIVLLVGDPGRVPLVSQRFDIIETKRSNREIITHTGRVGNTRITVLSTGMGTDNIDIVMNELDALANVDFETRTLKKEHRTLKIIRMGTCGILQPDIPINSLIASQYGFGFDGLLQFYQHDSSIYDDLVDSFIEKTNWGERLPHPYCIPATPALLSQVAFDMVQGITASAPGFYGPQGREIRTPLAFPEMNKKIEQFRYKDLRFTNLEMECSAIYGLGHLLNHETLTVCVGVANRVTKEFTSNYQIHMDQLIDTVIERITK